MASSTGDAPPSLPNAPVGGGGDVQQEEVKPSGNGASPGNATPMNPLLLASACHGSSAALKFLFDEEDKEEPPMMMATPEFLVRLAGYTPRSSTGRTLTVPQASDDLEAGVDLPAALLPAPDDAEAGADQLAGPPDDAEAGADQPAGAPDDAEAGADQPAGAPDTAEAGADQPAALRAAATDTAAAGTHQPATLQAVAWDDQLPGVDHVVEDAVVLLALPAAARLLKGVTAEGDTALHVVATNGESTQFLECASIIDQRDQDLLFVVNKNGDTPLHCAARAGKTKTVSRLIELAGSRNRMHELLRKENFRKETALHEAICIGSKGIVKHLLKADPLLANYPEKGTSPLYLAICQRKSTITHMLYTMSHGNLSYNGPHGKNALHAATFQGTEITKQMLNWNNSLAAHGDRDGSTPLHMASSFKHSVAFKILFEANPAAVYQADNKGLFPIHVAASVGVQDTIRIILENYPSSAGLRTAQGRTFLHVAVEKGRLNIVSFVCRTTSLAWILNMRDNHGNTAVHLAVQSGKLRIFCSLYGNKEVLLSSANNSEETPIDLSRNFLPPGMTYVWSSEIRIYRALTFFGTNHSGLRWDQHEEKYSRKLKLEDKAKEEEKVKDSSQILGISSVLIASVAFGATFAVPGGFIADDHTNRGTPTLAGRYTFDAFMIANALAFVCSLIATIGLTLSGSSLYNMRTRIINLATSVFFISTSVTSLAAAFALGVYMVLAPVARPTAFAVCVLTPLLVLYRNIEVMAMLFILARPLCLRLGPIRATRWLMWVIITRISKELWPFVIIFGWAAIAQKLRNH